MNSLNIKKIENSVTSVKYPETSINGCTFPNFTYDGYWIYQRYIGNISGYFKPLLKTYISQVIKYTQEHYPLFIFI